MADAALFIGFGSVVRGRENQALQVFQDSLAYYGRLQQAGTIESFEPVILQPHGGDLTGFILLRGERARLQDLTGEDEFQTIVSRALLIVDNLGVVNAAIGSSLAEGIIRSQAAIAQIGS